MGNRLSKIATRTGDAGMTGLGDGSRVEKDHLRICAMGDVDELNSQIGVLMTEEFPDSIANDLRNLLLRVQHDLFDLGGELCIPNYTLLKTLSDLLFVLARVLNRAAGGHDVLWKNQNKVDET